MVELGIEKITEKNVQLTSTTVEDLKNLQIRNRI
jgi:hypothetical protein